MIRIIRLPRLQELIHSLHLHIDSLKNQVGSLLDEAEAKDRLVAAIKQQLDMRDKRIRELAKQLQEAGGQLAEASTALEAKSVLLKDTEQVGALRISKHALSPFPDLACFMFCSPHGTLRNVQAWFAIRSSWHSVAGSRTHALKSVS